MSIVETVVGGGLTLAGTLAGFGVSYLIEDRRSRREVRLRSQDVRRTALDEVFVALTDCYFDVRRAVNSPPMTLAQYHASVMPAIRKFEMTIYRRALWISSAWVQVAAASRAFARTALALQIRTPDFPAQSRPPLETVPLDMKAYEDAYFAAGKAIGNALGIPGLEIELRNIMEIPESEFPRTDSLQRK